jgi:hypothetical protein
MKLPHQRIGAAEHFGGGAPCEGQKQDSAGIGAVGNQPCDAMHQRGGFAGACAGHDQKRPVAVGGGFALLRIKMREKVFDRGRLGH